MCDKCKVLEQKVALLEWAVAKHENRLAEREKVVLEEYAAGASLPELHRKHGIPRLKLRQLVSDAGILRPPGRPRQSDQPPSDGFDIDGPWTETDRTVFDMTSQGHTNKEIAQVVGKSESWVQIRTHAWWKRGAE